MSDEFAGSLRERIVIERPIGQRTAQGTRIAGWVVVARCLAAIVSEGAGNETEAMALSVMQRFRVTIRRRDGIAIDQRLRWRKRMLMIRQIVEDPRYRDRLTIRCEEIR